MTLTTVRTDPAPDEVDPTSEDVGPTKRRLPRWLRGHPVRLTVCILVGVLLLFQMTVAVGVIVTMRANNPKGTAFMAANPDGVIYQWVDGDNISRNLLVAIIAHEDAPFPDRTGPFTLEEFWGRVDAYLHNRPDPSGSTLDQQLVKNMFLSPDRSIQRKAAEADLAVVADLVTSKHRRLELYANVAQMGPGIYGACAASWYYFNEDPAKLTLDQSAQLVGLLPEPDAHPRAKGSGVQYRPPTKDRIGDTVAWTRAHLITQVHGVNGLEANVKIGFYGTAQTHTGGVKCDAMPAPVYDRLITEGVAVPQGTKIAEPVVPAQALSLAQILAVGKTHSLLEILTWRAPAPPDGATE